MYKFILCSTCAKVQKRVIKIKKLCVSRVQFYFKCIPNSMLFRTFCCFGAHTHVLEFGKCFMKKSNTTNVQFFGSDEIFCRFFLKLTLSIKMEQKYLFHVLIQSFWIFYHFCQNAIGTIFIVKSLLCFRTCTLTFKTSYQWK